MAHHSGTVGASSRSGSFVTVTQPEGSDLLKRLHLGTFSRSRFAVDAMVAFVCLLASAGLVYLPGLLDLPVAHMVNTSLTHITALNVMFYDLDAYATFGGGVFVAVVWACWFTAKTEEQDELRSRLMAGVLVSIPAGALSRFLQHRLHSHPRPFFDPALGYHPVFASSVQRLNTWNSFPSDHATVFAALVTSVCIVRADLRKFIIPWLAVVEFARLLMGAHYPTDLLGGAALGALMVFLAQAPWVVKACQRLVHTAKTRSFVFYGIAFAVTYQIATLFGDLRGVMQPIQK